MSESIPLEDSASQQTISNFDVSNVPGILHMTELDPIEGIEESLCHNGSPNTSIQSSESSGFLTLATASSSNSTERRWKLGLLFCVLAFRFKTHNLAQGIKWLNWDITGDDIAVGDCGVGVVYWESSGNWARGRDGTAKSCLSSFGPKTDGLPRWEHWFTIGA